MQICVSFVSHRSLCGSFLLLELGAADLGVSSDSPVFISVHVRLGNQGDSGHANPIRIITGLYSSIKPTDGQLISAYVSQC